MAEATVGTSYLSATRFVEFALFAEEVLEMLAAAGDGEHVVGGGVAQDVDEELEGQRRDEVHRRRAKRTFVACGTFRRWL